MNENFNIVLVILAAVLSTDFNIAECTFFILVYKKMLLLVVASTIANS